MRAGSFCLPDIDISVQSGELKFGAPAVDRTQHGAVSLDLVLALFGIGLLNHRFSRSPEFHVKVAVNLTVVRFHGEVGCEIGWQGHVDISVQRTERHGTTAFHARHGDSYGA